MFTVIFLACVIISLVYLYLNRDKDYWKKRNVIQAGELLFSEFSKGNRSLAEVYKDVYEDHTDAPYVGVSLGAKKGLILRDLENIQTVLASEFESFHHRGIIINKSDLLADNVLFMEDYKRWRLVRHKISPIFTSSKLKNMCYIIEKTARDFVETVKERKDMQNVPFTALYTYTTASIGASVFGIDTHLTNTMDSPFLEMSWKSISPSFIGNLKFFIMNLSERLFRLLNLKIFGEFEDFFIGVVKNVLDTRRKDKRTVHDFIDMGLELQKNGTMKDSSTGYELEPTDEVLAAQAFFFFIAGTDTSSNAMHFTLLELAGHPDILNRLHKELDETFEKHGEITFDVIEKLKYLDMVLNEAMRKYPPIGTIQRLCVKETVLPVGKVKVEKGIATIIPIYALHRDEKYYPNPEVFDPERFAPENVGRIPKMAYLPFGEGKRMCIGARYARLQVKIGLAFLLKSFTLRHQVYSPKYFEKSPFSLRDPDAKYELVLRNT